MKKEWILGGYGSLILILFYGVAQAETTSVAVGKGVHYSDGGGIFLTYTPSRRLEFQFSSWDGDNANTALGVGYPLTAGDKIKVGWTPGLAFMADTTENLGTTWQFSNRFELGYHPNDRTEAFFAWMHYSNGAEAFNHDYGPNLGENFISVGFRMSLGGRASR